VTRSNLLLVVSGLAAFAALAPACSSSSSPGVSPPGGDDSGAGGGGGAAYDDGGDGAIQAPPDASACAPSAVETLDAGAPNVPKGAAACTRDLDCPIGQFCYAPQLKCVDPTAVGYSAGDGTGGHAPGGGGCEPALALPAACEATSLDWTPTVDVSRDPGSLVESDTVLAADGSGTVVAAWSTIPYPAGAVSQKNQLAVSHDHGATFTKVTTPTDSPTSASNDAVLAYDPQRGLYYYVWEGYENDFKGAQHVWLSTSTEGNVWSTLALVDAPGDYVTGGALDFPWIAVNPVTGLAYVSYEAAPPNTNGSERLVVLEGAPPVDGGAGDAGSVDAGAGDAGGAGDAAAPGSLALTDGTRVGASYADLARGAFDASGTYYAAWMELADQATGFGGKLSGSTQNGIWFTRVDLAGGQPVPLAKNVKVSGASEAVNFDGPSIAVRGDDSRVHVSYVVGTNDAVDVVVATSTDRGQTWSASVKVNDDGPPPCATHFHSSLAVDVSGRLYAFWYDDRDGAGHFFYGVSDDGGASFHANRLVSAPSFPFDTFQYSTGWLGDYFEPAVTPSHVYVLFADGREGDQSHAFFAQSALP
jgi:hypothetical protein